MYIFEYRKRSHRNCRRLKQTEEENSFSSGVLEGRKGTKIKEMSTRDVSLFLKEGSLNVIIDRNSLRHANSISRDFEQLLSHPLLRPQLSYSLVQFSPLGSATLAKLLDVPMVDGTSRRGKKGKKKRGREKKRRRVRYKTKGNEGAGKVSSRGRLDDELFAANNESWGHLPLSSIIHN